MANMMNRTFVNEAVDVLQGVKLLQHDELLVDKRSIRGVVLLVGAKHQNKVATARIAMSLKRVQIANVATVMGANMAIAMSAMVAVDKVARIVVTAMICCPNVSSRGDSQYRNVKREPSQ